MLENSNEKSDKAKAQAASARGERDAEHQARRDAFAGGRASTSGRSLKTFGRGGSGGGSSQQKSKPLNFSSECQKLAARFDAADKCPAIVFLYESEALLPRRPRL